MGAANRKPQAESTQQAGLSLESNTETFRRAWDALRTDALAPVERREGRNVSKADLLFYETPAGSWAVKDYRRRPWWVRRPLARWWVRREARAYRAAHGVEGLPRCLGTPDPERLVLERVPGVPLAELPPGAVPPAVFRRLEALVETLHRRGVALGDLHHRDVLVDPDGRVHVVDLVTAFVAGERPGPLRRRLFSLLADLDRIALARMRARWTGGGDAAPATVRPSTRRWYRRGRRLKALWDRLRRRRGRERTP